jgi:MinD superfamily P-loop ATPase
VCPEKAISQGVRRIGRVETAAVRGLTFTRGTLRVGETQVPPVIEAVKEVPAGGGLVIRDAPPGASCPTVAALAGSQFVVLVTEPTPFGLHDLKAAVELVRHLNLPCGVVVNREGSGDDRVQDYCREEGLPLLRGLPFRRDVAESISRGGLVVDDVPDMRRPFADLLEQVVARTREVTS